MVRDDLWRVIRHLELALPGTERLRAKVEEEKMEPLPGLIRFGAVSRAMPLAKWEELPQVKQARIRDEERAAAARACRWAEELELIGDERLARFRQRLSGARPGPTA